MSLVKDLNITLKDFFPTVGEARIVISSDDDGTPWQAMVSTRLYVALAHLAQKRAMSTTNLLQQLKHEIHASDFH